jgi:hypothetical protein
MNYGFEFTVETFQNRPGVVTAKTDIGFFLTLPLPVQYCAIGGTDTGGTVDPGGDTSKPTISTKPATNILDTSATLQGEVIDTGGYVNCNSYFEWGTTTSYGSSHFLGPFGTGDYDITANNLIPGTIYHFRMKSSNPEGWAFGNDMTFTTTGGGSAQLSVQTNPATNVATTTARLNGTLTLFTSTGELAHRMARARHYLHPPTRLQHSLPISLLCLQEQLIIIDLLSKTAVTTGPTETI